MSISSVNLTRNKNLGEMQYIEWKVHHTCKSQNANVWKLQQIIKQQNRKTSGKKDGLHGLLC